ncbi:MAG: gamma-glutamyltransferase [Planctomycetota bacterium]
MPRTPVARGRGRAVLALLVSFACLAIPLRAQEGGDRYSGRPFATRSPVLARNGMACTSQPLATQVALDVLRRGGNAVDAAIAANAALGLMEPTGCGVGGDLFAIVWDAKEKKLFGYNGSGRSPRGLTRDELLRVVPRRGEDGGVILSAPPRIPAHGPLPVSVPGCVDGWFALHDRFGHLPMKDLLAPAIGYARDGFPVSQLIARYWSGNAAAFARSRDLTEKENFARTFLVDGRAPAEGEIFRNRDLARLYARIAEEGRAGFYGGETAKTIDAYMKRVGGYLRASDLEEHRGEWVEPVSVNYRGYDVYELPPNGQGIAALQMLNLLEGYELAKMEHNSADYLHLLIEAKKVAYEDRAKFYADPAFSRVPVKGLLAKDYAAARRALIDPEKAQRRIAAGNPSLEEGDTIYLATADRWGNMVSLIQSNYRGMGSGLVPDGLGFVLQDRGELFALEEGHANDYAPGKRPFHTIIPAFAMKDGAPWLCFGVMGGGMQPQGHVQVLLNLIDFGMNVQEAGDAARFNHEGSSQPTGDVMRDGGQVAIESGVPEAIRTELQRRGHRLKARSSFGGYQAILRDPATGVYHGASEMRKDGQAAGF